MDLSREHLFLRRANEIQQFRLPRWSELPQERMLRQPMLQYIDELLSPLFAQNTIITGTMVQNYVKWGLAPRPVNRYYNDIHIAYFIVLSILKEIIPMQSVYTGINLLTRLMSIEAAYDSFCLQMEDSLTRVTSFLFQPLQKSLQLEFAGLKTDPEKLTLAFVCESLAFKLVAEMFINEQGFMRFLGDKDSQDSLIE